MRKFQVITLFPEMFSGVFENSMMWKAQKDKIVELSTINLRDFGIGPRKQVDDTPYGGGAGMVLKVEPLVTCLEHVLGLAPEIARTKTRVIVTSAKGELYTQRHTERLSTDYERIIFVCGRYEGIDQRFIDHCVDEEFSIGEYVLTGGELPALIMLDSIARLVPGVLGNEESSVHESYSKEGGREHPQYTKPEVYRDWSVPSILLSGNHKAIDDWRTENRKPL